MTELRLTVGGSLHCQPITSSPEQWPWQPLFSASEGRTFLGWFTYHQGSFKNTALGPTDKVKSTMAVCMRQRDFGNLDQVHFDPPFTTEPARRLSQGNSI